MTMSANNKRGDIVILDDRKKQILGAIIENYIETAEPVGSRTIARLGYLNVSSATIRNEMADLEEMGLLVQPHASAGRIPSQMGYRVYVDKLMKHYELTAKEISRMKYFMELKINDVEKMVQEIANIYSKLTNYTVIGFSPGNNKCYIKNFHMVPIDEKSALLIVVTNNNNVKNKKIVLQNEIDMKTALRISNILNEKLAGITVDKINLSKITQIQEEMSEHSTILMQILDFINECIESFDDSEVFSKGVSNLLNFPEYSNVKKAKELLDFLDNRNNIQRAVALGENKKVKIIIGDENDVVELKDCSVILSPYKYGKNGYGIIGLIGPTRMNYSKAVSNIEFLTQHFEHLLPDDEGGGHDE